MFNRFLNKIGEAAKSPQQIQRSPGHEAEETTESAAEGFLCPSCMLAFPSPEVLQNHYEVSHGQEVNGTVESRSQFLCPACKMRFGCDQELQSHFTRHHTEKGQKSHEELTSLRQDLDELQTSLKEERWYSEELKKELGRVQTSLQGAGEGSTQAAMELYRSQVRTLEESKTLALSEVVLLKQHLEECKTDKDILREEKSKLEQKTAALAGDYASVQAQLDESKSDNEVLKSELSSNQAEIEKLTSEIHQRLGAEDAAVLRQELISVQKMMDDDALKAEAEKDTIANQCLKLETEKKLLEQEIKVLQDRVTSTVDKNIADLSLHVFCQSQLEDARQERDSLTKDLEQERLRNAAFQDKCSAMQTELDHRNVCIQDEMRRATMLLEKQQELTLQLSQTNLEKEKLGGQVCDWQNQVEKLQSELSKIQENCITLSSSNDDLKQQLLQDNSQAVELKQSLDQKENRMSELDSECNKLKETVERLESERTELCSKIEAGDGAKTAIAQLQQENVSLQEQAQKQQTATTKASQKAQQQVEALSKQLKEFKVQLESLKGQDEKNQALLQESKKSLLEAKSKEEQYAQELKVKNEKLLAIETSNLSLKSSLESKSQEIQSTSSNLEKVTLEVAALREELKQASIRLTQEQSNCERVKEETRAHVQSLISEKSSMATSLQDCQKKLTTLEEDMKREQSEWKNTSTELGSSINQLQAMLSEESSLRQNEKALSEQQMIDWNQNLEAKEEELVALRALLADEKERGIACGTQLQEAIALKDELFDSKQELESQLKSLEFELKEERQMKEKSQHQLNTSQAQLIESQEHAARIKKAHDDLQELKEEIGERIQQLESECAQLSQAKENLTTLKVKLEHQLEEKSKKEQDFVAKMRTLEQRNVTLLEEFTAEKLQAQKAFLEVKAAKEAAIEENQQLKYQLSTALETLSQAISKHDYTVSEAEDKIKQLEELLVDSKEELVRCQGNYTDLESRVEEERSQQEAQVCILQENQTTLRQDLTQQQNRAHDLQEKLADLSGQKLELEAKLENALDERRALLERCLRSEEECDKLQSATSELHRKYDDTLAALHEMGRENQTLQIENTKLLQRKWTDDSQVSHCTSCKKMFTVTLRRHHCRSCGSIFCHDCSSKSATLASYKKPVRVCENCFDEVNI